MIKKKTQVLQIRVDEELLLRYKKFAEYQGVHISVALRHAMLQSCEQLDRHIAFLETKRLKEMNKK